MKENSIFAWKQFNFMQNSQREHTAGKRVRPRNLPSFEKKRMDFGTWTYVHRAGICMTVIVFLLFAIAFVTMKITMASIASVAVIELEMEIPEPPATSEEQQSRFIDDYSRVANRVSNEGGRSDDNRRRTGGGSAGMDGAGGRYHSSGDAEAAELREMAGRLGGQMGANRAAYEDGLKRVGEMRNQRAGADDGADSENRRAKLQGSIAVSYSFLDPVRHDDILIVPAYMCEGGGTVVVDATLDRNGYVTSAVVNRAGSSTDDCMRSTAIKAALGSRFNIDVSAPAKHRGTITYVFKPQ